MAAPFEFTAPPRIWFGPGTLRQAGPLAHAWGVRALVVTGGHPARAKPLLELLAAEGIAATVFPVPVEPTTDLVRQGVALALEQPSELVIGFGGGSPLDAAKAIAILATNGGDPLDYLEVIGRGQPFLKPALPLLAIPTTAGTGSEATRNAVIASPEHRVKVSLRSLLMVPRIALVDPELTYDVPPAVTASTGMDALTQLIEPFTSRRANPLADAFCRDGIARVARSLHRAFTDGRDAAAREDLALASLYGGLALANAGLGVVHGFAGPVGGTFQAPHGAVCAALLPHVIAMNVQALRQREPEHPALFRYAEIAELLTGHEGVPVEAGVTWLQDLAAGLGIPPLRTYGVTEADIPVLVEKTAVASGTQTNPVTLTREELAEILARAL